MKLLSDLDFSGKRVFLRADLDVPVEQLTIDNSQLTGAARLQNLKPTVDYLLGHGVKQIIIAGHIGRPKGSDPKLSTKQLIGPLEKILGQKILFSEQLTGDNLQLTEINESNVKGSGETGSIVLLENLRFWPGEEANDSEFAKKLTVLADVYVNDAFGVCHRENASMVALPALLPHVAGLHLEKEVEVLGNLLKNSARPFVAIIGGAKVETKEPLIKNLARIADNVLIGGVLPIEIGKKFEKFSGNVIVGKLTVDDKELSDESIQQFENIIAGAKTVVWNGPLGKFEEGCTKGSLAIADSIAKSGAYSVVGGGDTEEMLAEHNLLDQFSFVSSGGGAMLEFLAGEELPGIKALD